uniref:Uncharacterized protein n=1 Tax=Anguilla anguilla TaxID=7936 RepID=A0A0E9QTR8_ANGAN
MTSTAGSISQLPLRDDWQLCSHTVTCYIHCGYGNRYITYI